jgi:hypothetical protein
MYPVQRAVRLTPLGVAHLPTWGVAWPLDETWEQVPYRSEAVERFFARYAHDEARALLQHAGFAILDSSTGEAGDRRWLQYLARVAPDAGGDERGSA